MKKIFLLFFVTMLLVSPCINAQAKGINAPVDTSNKFDEVFFTYDEFLELFTLDDYDHFLLKEKFKPYYNRILIDRFYNNIYRMDGMVLEYEENMLPVYTVGQFHMPYFDMPINTRSSIKVSWQFELVFLFGEAIALKENIKYESISGTYYTKGLEYYFIVMIHTGPGKFDENRDIGIAIKTKFNTTYDKLNDYHYPSEDEYYAMYSAGSKPTVTPTPKPTATPTPKPTATPTPEPTATPTPEPTATPTPEPTTTPTPEPTATPTPEPTAAPTPEPTATPTPEPTATPTPEPTATPIITLNPNSNVIDKPDDFNGEYQVNDVILYIIVVLTIIIIGGSIVAYVVTKRKK